MALYRRLSEPGATWFFTLATEQRRPLLTRAEVVAAISAVVFEVRRREPFELLAWAILPDHLHVVVRLPDGDAAYARRISIFKRLVSQRVVSRSDPARRESMRKRREAGFWQRRFWEHMIRDEADLHRHLDYIHYNAVKHAHAASAAAWPYSSFHAFVRRGVLPAAWSAPPESSAGHRVAAFGE
jgi:putative transposase